MSHTHCWDVVDGHAECLNRGECCLPYDPRCKMKANLNLEIAQCNWHCYCGAQCGGIENHDKFTLGTSHQCPVHYRAMSLEQMMVAQFHKKYGYTVNSSPTVIPPEDSTFRYNLMQEELHELVRAMDTNNMVEIADAIADLLYVTYGTANFYGINMAPVFSEVHRSNMSKELSRDTKYGHGKPIKGKDFKPPEIQRILDNQ